MKKESTVMYVLRLTVTLLLITAFVAAALAGVNAITKDKIAAAQQEKADQAKNTVLGLQDATFTQATFTADDKVKGVYLPEGGDSSAYAVEVVTPGFGGDITMMVGIRDGKVSGVVIVNQTETAGLGAIAADSGDEGVKFRNAFIGTESAVSVDKDGGSIDSITGATITSRAVADGVNAALSVKLG